MLCTLGRLLLRCSVYNTNTAVAYRYLEADREGVGLLQTVILPAVMEEVLTSRQRRVEAVRSAWEDGDGSAGDGDAAGVEDERDGGRPRDAPGVEDERDDRRSRSSQTRCPDRRQGTRVSHFFFWYEKPAY